MSTDMSIDPAEVLIWHLEDKLIPVHVVPDTHSIIQHGNEHVHGFTLAAELYGILRSNVIEELILGSSSPFIGL